MSLRKITLIIPFVGVAILSSTLARANTTAFELPEECLVKAVLKNRPKGYDVGYETRLSFSNDENKVMEGEEYHKGRWCNNTCPDVPETYFVKPECRHLLENAAKLTRLDYLSDVPKEKILPYLPSEKRVYCGLQPPDDNKCSSAKILELSAVVPLEINNEQFAPPPTLDLIAAYKSRDLNKLYFTARDTAILYAIVGLPVKKGLGAYTIASTAGKNVFVRKATVLFGQIVSRTSTDYWSYRSLPTSFNSDLDLMYYAFEKDWKKVVSGHWVWGNPDVRILMDAIRDRAARLKNYWAQSRRLYDFNPRKTDDQGNEKSQGMLLDNRKLQLKDFVNEKPIFEYPAKELESRKIIRLVSELSENITQLASYFLANSKNTNVLLEAASYWWAARSVQIEFGCDSKTDTPFPNASNLVRIQPDHQNCRRNYSNRAYLALNKTILKENAIALTSMEWTLAVALSSRVERTRLYLKWLETLPSQVRKGVFPSAEDVSTLLHELLQTEDELREGKVLTWNGLRPASQDDILALRMFQDKTRVGLIALKDAASEKKWENSEFFQAFRLLWGLMKKRLNLDEWTLTSDSETIKNETASFEKTLGTLSLAKTKDRAEILSQFALTLQTSESEPLLGAELCRSWLKWLSSNREDARKNGFTLRAPKIPFYYGSCAGLAGFWSTQKEEGFDPHPDKIEAQCRAGHALSCLIGFHLDEKLASALTLEEWTRLLTEHPARLKISELLYERFAAQYAARSKSKSVREKEKRLWKNAGQSIHKRVRDLFYDQTFPLPPSFEVFSGCLSSKDLASLVSFDVSIEAELEKIAFKPECAYPKPEELRKIVLTIARLRTMSLPTGLRRDGRKELVEPFIRDLWIETPVSALFRYRRWVEIMYPYSKNWLAAARRSKRIRDNEISDAYEPYLSHLRNREESALYFQSTKDSWEVAVTVWYKFISLLMQVQGCEDHPDDMTCKRDEFFHGNPNNESDLL